MFSRSNLVLFNYPPSQHVLYLLTQSLAVSPVLSDFTALASAALAIVGMVLQWRYPWYRMTLEERVKDGAMTELRARARVKFYEHFAPILTLFSLSILLGLVVCLNWG